MFFVEVLYPKLLIHRRKWEIDLTVCNSLKNLFSNYANFRRKAGIVYEAAFCGKF